jgi:predicted dehydrogenase
METIEVMKTYNWGILGTGNIARKFCQALHLLDNAVIYAVGSRSQEKAEKFAAEFKIAKAYGSYEELTADPAIDIIYVATPHTFHLKNTLMALKNGKHVLCEKPLAINSAEVRVMLSEALQRRLFLMEALWPPFQGNYVKGKEIIDSGTLGRVKHIYGKFAFDVGYNPLKRTFNLELGGGSLLDIGIYPVIDILRFMGVPDIIEAKSDLAPTGADMSTSMIFMYSDGRIAEAYCSFAIPAGISTEINLERGNIILSRGREKGQHLVIDAVDSEPQEMLFNPAAFGFQFEAAEVMKCLDNGLLESPVVPHSFSADLIEVLDKIRKIAGIVYPGHD